MRRIKLIKPSVLAIIPALYLNQKQSRQKLVCFQDIPTKQLIRGEYENKIRFMSPPEKVFELFATIRTEDGLFMSYQDFMKALIPFNYSAQDEEDEEDNEKYKHQFNSLLKYADINSDGKISIYEYFMLIRILQIVEKELYQSINNAQSLSQQQLIDYLDNSKSAFRLTITDSILDPRLVKLSTDEYQQTRKDMINKIFNGNNEITMESFLQVRTDLFNEILEEEFSRFKVIKKNGIDYISNQSFAKSIICFLNNNKAHKYINIIQKIKLPDELVSFEEYKEFHSFINYNKYLLEQELEQSGVITRKNLKKIIDQQIQLKYKKKRKITNSQINTFIQILDINGNGLIDCFEFAGIVETRNYFRINQQNQKVTEFWYDIPKKANTWIGKLQRIWDIIQEE